MRFKSNYRNRENELMDDPAIDPLILDAAVADINKCNQVLGGYKFTKQAVKSIISRNPDRPYRIIDIGCSDGAMLRYLKDAIPEYDLDLIGIDLSPRSIQQAIESSVDYEGIRFRESDIFKEPLENLKCDIVILTLTLHHFKEEEIIKFLKRFIEMADIAVIINDLHRNPIAYGFFKLFSPIFIESDISIHDGLISIAAGFRKADFTRYSKALALKNDRLTWKWSFRYIWTILVDERKN